MLTLKHSCSSGNLVCGNSTFDVGDSIDVRQLDALWLAGCTRGVDNVTS